MTKNHTRTHGPKLGRPKLTVPSDLRRINIMLKESHIQHVKDLGGGNISLGLRKIIEEDMNFYYGLKKR